MPHDGQDTVMTANPVLDDLLGLTAAALVPVETVFTAATARLRALVTVAGRVDAALMDAHQTAAHGLAWLATYRQALRQMQGWAEALQAQGRFGEMEQLLLQIGFGEYLAQIAGGIPMSQGEMLRLQDIGLAPDEAELLLTPEVVVLIRGGNSQAARSRLVDLMQDQGGAITVGASGLDDELEMIRDQFRRFAVERVEPQAQGWHLRDELIPLEIIEELAGMACLA